MLFQMNSIVPKPLSNQLPLPLQSSPQKTPLEPDNLEKTLSDLIGGVVKLTITENRTRMVAFRKTATRHMVRLQRSFLSADEGVIEALGAWMRKPKAGIPEVVRKFVQSIVSERRPAQERKRILITRGQVYDLLRLSKEVNHRFFQDRVSAQITFGRDTSDHRVQIRRLGSYSRDHNLITIHPLLDSHRVPESVIAFTIYHEMLHALQPPGHKRPHDAEFKRREKAHPDYARVTAWRKANSRFLIGGG